MLSQLRVEPSDDEECAALFKLYEASYETVEKARTEMYVLPSDSRLVPLSHFPSLLRPCPSVTLALPFPPAVLPFRHAGLYPLVVCSRGAQGTILDVLLDVGTDKDRCPVSTLCTCA